MPYIDFIAAAAGGGGGEITDTFPATNQTVEISQSHALDLFNSDTGTLIAATLTLTGNLSGNITFTNSSGSASPTIRRTLITELYYTSTIASLGSIFSASFPNAAMSVTTGPQIVPGSSSYVSGFLNDTDVVVIDLISILSDLQINGGGTFNIGVASLSGASDTGSAPSVTRSTTHWSAGLSGSITYTYT